jgi:hypothetical protein
MVKRATHDNRVHSFDSSFLAPTYLPSLRIYITIELAKLVQMGQELVKLLVFTLRLERPKSSAFTGCLVK